jgi:hypothetical protein
MGFFANLSRAARFYAGATLAGAVSVFAGVEGWRIMEYLVSSDGSANPPTSGLDVVSLGISLIVAPLYLWIAYRTESEHRGLYLVLAGCNLLLSTGALYGLFAFTGRLIPGIAEYGPLAATCLTMSGLLGAYLLFHRRTNR